MPRLYRFECDKCGYSLPPGEGGYMYVTDQSGNRIACLHPSEDSMVFAVLGENATTQLIKERTGRNSHCVCMDCLAEFDLDVQRDVIACPSCESPRASTVIELIGKSCPKCKGGTIQRIDSGKMS